MTQRAMYLFPCLQAISLANFRFIPLQSIITPTTAYVIIYVTVLLLFCVQVLLLNRGTKTTLTGFQDRKWAARQQNQQIVPGLFIKQIVYSLRQH